MSLERPTYRCPVCRDSELVIDSENLNAAKPCPACAALKRAERLQVICGLTEDERRVSLEQIIAPERSQTANMVKAARAFIDAPYGMLTIYGTCGNAKTLTLQAIVNAALQRGIPAIYATFYDVVDWIRESFNDKSEIRASVKVQRLRDVPILCLDELDKVKMTDWVRELQTELIDWRYRNGLARKCGTVFAMNCEIDTLPEWIASRLKDGRHVVVQNNDKDLRPLMRGLRRVIL